MMPSEFVTMDGETSEFNLDNVIDVVNGWSEIRSGWQGFVVYAPESDKFIELMSTVPDVRGNSADHAAEVEARYVETTYGLSSQQVSTLRRAPSQWAFIKNR